MSYNPSTLLEMLKGMQGQQEAQFKYGGLQGLGDYGRREQEGYTYIIHVWIQDRSMALACFRDFASVPGRDAVQATRHSDGCRYESTQSGLIGHPQWWKKVDAAATPAKQEESMKNFTEKQLTDGQYETLERIETPKPGEQFDMNKLAVAAVLTINAAVAIIHDMQRKIAQLEALVESAPVETEDAAEFSLPKLGDKYSDVAA